MMFQMVAASCGNRALNVDVGIIDCFSAKIGKIGERGKREEEKGSRNNLLMRRFMFVQYEGVCRLLGLSQPGSLGYAGLHVTVFDPDTVTEANIGR